ncbi:MAG TPA: helix-turn-helix transcriptional regulator, partial [Candidatus Limnocylindria bacterium]|nr:helix-turn-helix transcriptional regulator [Candidatus Limnocylindria bacterium]
LLAALRSGTNNTLTEAGLQRMQLTALDPAAARALLQSRAAHVLPATRDRVLAAAAGNPLALIELPLALESSSATDAVPGEPLPLTDHLERAFAARAQGLPQATHKLLLVAAANDGDDIVEIVAAGRQFGGERLGVGALAPAEVAGLIEVDSARVRFRHPLMRSAIYQAAPVAERRAVHDALASTLALQPDRRAWHRAAGVIGPDDVVAEELDEAATRAERRGAISVAAVALERAAALTTDDANKGARLLRATLLEFQLGHPDQVRRLMALAGGLSLLPHDRFELAGFSAMFDPGLPGDAMLVGAMVTTAAQARAAGESDIGLDLLRIAAVRAWWSDPGEEARAALLAASKQLTVRDEDPRRAYVVAILALADPIGHGSEVLRAIERMAPQFADDAISLRYLSQSAQVVGDHQRAVLLYSTAIPVLRSQGRLGFLASSLAHLAWLSIDLGDWRTAASAAEEAARLAEETHQPLWIAAARAAQALLAGLRGDPVTALALAREAERVATTARHEGVVGDRVLMSERSLLAGLQRARGIASLLAGRVDEAYGHLRRTFEARDPAYHYMTSWSGLDHLADAAGPKRRDDARSILEPYEPLAAMTSAPGVRLVVAYARAVLADDNRAEALFLAALDENLVGWPLMRARLQLAYGAWLRRQRRASESRAPLRSARDAFDAIGAAPWAERARVELRASGEASERARTDPSDHLTPQELQIAQLVAEGLSNRDIGQRLYLSHRTVGSHLYRIFPKLGITSRAQIRSAMGRAAGEGMRLSPER